MSKYTITPRMITNYSLTKDQITILKKYYGFKMETGSLSLDDNQIDGALEKVVKECIESSQNVTAVTSINYETGLLGVLRNLGAEKIEQYKDSLYKIDNNITDFVSYAQEKARLLTKLYFLDSDNQDEYGYFLVAIGHFIPFDQSLIGLLNKSVQALDRNVFLFKLNDLCNEIMGKMRTFDFFSIREFANLPKEYYKFFNFLELLRINIQKNRADELNRVLSGSYDDAQGQMTQKKSEKLQEIEREYLICSNQTPKESFSLEFNKIPVDLMRELKNIYSEVIKEAKLNDEVRFKSIYNALTQKEYLSAFKLAQQPRYKYRNPLIYILLARLVLENATALLVKEIKNNGITTANKDVIMKLFRYFLLSLSRIEYEERVGKIVDGIINGVENKDYLLALISKLYYSGSYEFKNEKPKTGFDMCQTADIAFSSCDYETATYYYARGLELLGEEGDNYAGWEKSYEESFTSFKKYHDKRM